VWAYAVGAMAYLPVWRERLAAAAVAVLGLVPAPAFAQERPLRIGYVTTQFGTAATAFEPLTRYLSSFLDGRPFEIVPLDSIEHMVEAADRSELDFVVASSVGLVTLTAKHRVRPIATITQASGTERYPWLASAVFVARGRSDLQRLEDARGQRVVGLSRRTLGGWLAALREWRQMGITESEFASLTFDPQPADLAATVCSGTADVGVLPIALFPTVAASCPGGLRVLPPPTITEVTVPVAVSTRLYPEAAVAAVANLPEDVVTRVAVALLSNDGGSPAARAFGVAGFTAPLGYTPVEQLMRELRIAPFESYGSLTFAEALRQHAGKVMIAMTLFVSVLLFAFVRARQLNAQIARSFAQWREADDERRHLESELQQSRRLESLGRVAGGVAHDFNNLLTVINGYSDILLAQPLGAEAHDEVQQIHKAGRRAAELTGQLLTFSRRQVTDVAAFDLNAVIRDAEPLLKRLAGEDVELDIRLAPSLPPIAGNVTQMNQVLMNLVVNARDATLPSGGRVTISTERVAVAAGGDHPASIALGDYVLLTVSDTGVGMSEETRQHIFEPFFSTKGEAGTGLGLSTVYGIVRQRRGDIDVWSEPGRGTRFRIWLPRAEHQTEPILPAPTDRPPVSGRRRILVVEDHDEVRAFALDVLRKAGFDVLEAASGNEALALANGATPIDLLLTDVVLGGMGGREVAERFARAYPSARVLFTSGYPDDVTAGRGVPRGAVAFLPKPYSPDALVSQVSELLTQPAPSRAPGH
jgi:signal transduction histidine kinase/ActR/RegA family two-component response regulator